MSDFSDKPFVAGSLVGLRSFGIDRLGRLYGPSYHAVFGPDVNIARCYVGETQPAAPTGSVMRRDSTATTSGATMMGSFLTGAMIFGDASTSTCRGYMTETCRCGFYAYFYNRRDYASEIRVDAIIEGFGSCVVGDSGFRAEKARLVAIAGVGESIDPIFVDRLKHNYPAVPVFLDADEAMTEFPLTPVDTTPAYDPSTDPDFWTRELV